MKRLAVIFFCILYLIPAVGVALDMHKCGKKIRVVSINSPHKNKCPCGTAMPFNCCKDVHVKVKIEDNQKASKSVINFRLSETNLFAFCSCTYDWRANFKNPVIRFFIYPRTAV